MVGVMRKSVNRLRVLRAERDVTQMEIAKRTGIQAMRYWKIEKGYLEPTADECKSLAKVLKCKVDDLGLTPCQMEKAS